MMMYNYSTFGYNPSTFQIDVFKEIEFGTGNIVVNAVAGSGKTTTAVSCLKLIPKNKHTIFLAFNKSIVKELTERVPEHIQVSTLHSFGCRMIMANFGKVKINENKAFNLGTELAKRWNIPADDSLFPYVGRVAKIVEYMRYNMLEDDDIEAIEEMADFYNIPRRSGESYNAIELFKAVNKRRLEIDFADMIYMPTFKDVRVKKFDYVFVDEAQDLNKAQQSMISKMLNREGRLICVGDPFQSIYGFAGADSKSYENMKTLKDNTKELPLSVCYRLTKQLVLHAQEIVPHIQYSETAEEGVPPRDGDINEINEKDFVLCRNVRPLVELFVELLRMGKKANIKGREIGKSIITLIEVTHQKSVDKLLKHLKVQKIKLKSKLQSKGVVRIDEHPKMIDFLEKEAIIKILSSKFKTTSQLIQFIDTIFLDDNIPGITLSTIHKAKGLEADKVFILFPQLMPSQYAITPSALVQESNLMYVARTRAKKELIYIRDFQPTPSEQDED